MIKKIFKHWEAILMVLLFISAIVHMSLGYELRALIYIILLLGIGLQTTSKELVEWIKTLCGLLYRIEKGREE
ncbi:hypothetical protein [Enterococcus sp. AZ192]|uniref:hypothetical protein n=1 Tax=unclassified Enterococcus TaxID=2608891 RepID=UPI003D2D1A56